MKSGNRNALIAPTAVALVATVAGCAALKGFTTDSLAQRQDTALEEAVSAKDKTEIAAIAVRQLNGYVVVEQDGRVRTAPVRVEPSIERSDNVDSEFTDAARDDQTVVVLENPYVVEDVENPANGLWYGAPKADTGEIFWVNENAVKLVEGTVSGPTFKVNSGIQVKPVESVSESGL